MTDKEKQAIETIKEKVFLYNFNKKMGIVDKMTEQGRKECEALETVLNLIEKKDKIIDEMAKYIVGGNRMHNVSVDEVKEYFKKKVGKM